MDSVAGTLGLKFCAGIVAGTNATFVLPAFETVTAPVPPEIEIPVPARIDVTPVFVRLTVVVPDAEIPVPVVIVLTPVLLTVTAPLGTSTEIPAPAVRVVTPPAPPDVAQNGVSRSR